ncbi:MAG: MlaD family protein [Actinomycetota bacterium]|jgi:phospholipid/cholesterol/gamma-HCH transport system substrate-binding protein
MRCSPAFLRHARQATMAVFLVTMAVTFAVLWVNFGGSLPGVTGGYSVTASLADTQNLVYDSEVRMAGVPVGKIRGLERTAESVDVKMELRGDAVPLHEGAKVVLRAKTLIEETYLEITDGTGPAIADGGRLPASAEQLSVKFDDLLDTLPFETREQLASLVRRLGVATDGEAQHLADTLAALGRLGRDGHDALDVLAAQSDNLSALVREGTRLLAVLDEGEGQIARMATSAERLFRATASRDEKLAETVRLLPGLLDRVKAASPPVRELAGALTPLADPLVRAAPHLEAALAELPGATAELRGLLPHLDTNLGLLPGTLTRTPAVAADASALLPVLRVGLADVNPMLAYLAPYAHDIGAFAANAAQVVTASGLDAGRFLLVIDAGSFTGDAVSTKVHNAYPPAGGATNPQPFSGTVPRVPEDPN